MKRNKRPERIDCLGMGIIPFDLLFNVANYPAAGSKIDANGFFMQGGGPVPNVVIGLSRLGMKTALPYLDHFLPAHNLESLVELAKTLRSVWR